MHLCSGGWEWYVNRNCFESRCARANLIGRSNSLLFWAWSVLAHGQWSTCSSLALQPTLLGLSSSTSPRRTNIAKVLGTRLPTTLYRTGHRLRSDCQCWLEQAARTYHRQQMCLLFEPLNYHGWSEQLFSNNFAIFADSTRWHRM